MADVVVKGVDQTTGRSRKPVTADVLLIDAETVRGSGNLTIDADALTVASTAGTLNLNSTGGGITMLAPAADDIWIGASSAQAHTIYVGDTFGSTFVGLYAGTGGLEFSTTGGNAIFTLAGSPSTGFQVNSNAIVELFGNTGLNFVATGGNATLAANASGATLNLVAPTGASTINLGTTGSPAINIGNAAGSILFGDQFSWATGLGAIQQILGPSDQQLRIASNGNNLRLVTPTTREIILDASAASSGLNFLANGTGGYFVMDVGDGGFDISTSSAATMVFSDSLSISQTSGAGTLSITGQGNMTFGSTSANVAVSIQSSNATGAVINVGTTGTPTINIAGATALLGYFGTAAAAQQAVAALTNNITAGGTDDQLADYTDLTTYATDAAAIRNNLYQLGRKLDQVVDALRLYGLLG